MQCYFSTVAAAVLSVSKLNSFVSCCMLPLASRCIFILCRRNGNKNISNMLSQHRNKGMLCTGPANLYLKIKKLSQLMVDRGKLTQTLKGIWFEGIVQQCVKHSCAFFLQRQMTESTSLLCILAIRTLAQKVDNGGILQTATIDQLK